MQDLAASVLARDIMVPDVASVRTEAPINYAAKLMGQRGIRHIVVLDELDRLVGLFSERDMFRHIARCSAGTRSSIGRMQVKDLMVHEPLTAGPETTLAELCRVLAEKKIGCLPIVDKHHKLCGIVSVVDVLRVVSDAPTRTATDSATASTPVEAPVEAGDGPVEAARFVEAAADEDFWE